MRQAYKSHRTANMRFKTGWRILVGPCAMALLYASPAVADVDLMALAFSGSTEGIETVPDNELQDYRGGIRDISFGFFITGDISTFDPNMGELPDGVNIISETPENVSIDIGLASLPGAGGLIQFTNVDGNNNIVNTNMTLNVVIIEDGVADPASILSGLSIGGP